MKLGKKLLALGLGAMMVIGAAGCGSDASQQDTGEAADTGSAAAVETAVSVVQGSSKIDSFLMLKAQNYSLL